MAGTEQIGQVIDEADFHIGQAAGGADVTLTHCIAAMQVVELQRIADALEILVAQGRHL